MIKIRNRVSLLIICLWSLTSNPAWAEKWSLLLHTTLNDLAPLSVTPAQQQWLKHKQTLRVGIMNTDFPPYGFRTYANDYEGLSADYLGVVSRQLGLKVQLIPYDNAGEMWRALIDGYIDLIPGFTGLSAPDRPLFSLPYSHEQPILAVKNAYLDTLPADLANVRVSVASGYVAPEEITRAYPEARVQVFDDYQQAMSAVSYGDTRVYIGNSYPVSRNFLNNLRIERFADVPVREARFLLRSEDKPLVDLINQALQAIPQEKTLKMQQTWRMGAADSMMKPVRFTDGEQSWLKKHRVIKVVIYGKDDTAPMAFIDANGAVRGIASDVLSLVTLRTGMQFTFQVNDAMTALVDEVNTRDADMVAALVPSVQRQKDMLFSFPYTRSAFALLTASHNQSVSSLSDLRGKRLALIKNAALAGMIKERYPEIKVQFYDNDAALYGSVVSGETDAAIGLLISADYQVNGRYRRKLKIVNTVGGSTSYIAFAVGKADPELREILNKVLMTIPPDELELLSNRWRPTNMVVIDSFWSRYRYIIVSVSAVALFLLLLAALRTLWLRRQIKLVSIKGRQLENQVALLEKLVESMPFPISLRNRERELMYCNQLALNMVDLPYKQVKGKKLEDSETYLNSEFISLLNEKMLAVINSNTSFHEDLTVELIKQPGDKPVRMTCSVWLLPWHNAEGEVVGTVMAMWDISEREELVKQLSEASERAEASNRAKSTFLSTMSHEIRTPMNAIIGMLDMAIKKGKQGEQDLQALEVAFESAEGLVGLIGDILDLSRVEGGHIEFRPVRINLAGLINQLLVIFNGLALDKNITLVKELPEDELPDVIGDPLRIKQVLSNLLSNAIKFTDQGGVTLRLRQHIDEARGKVRYTIEIQDSGGGINEAQQAALFQPFSQAENRRAGTGLGLYISRNLCESMNGRLTLTSELNVGTRVSAEMEFPVAEQPAEAGLQEPGRMPSTEALSVLVVDDNVANRILLAKQLAWLGHHAHAAADGFEGLGLWEQHAFDVVITDCNMPGMNGYQFTQQIREREALNNKNAVWIIGFTANAMHEIIGRCLGAGMNGCLFKPCSIASLSEALSKRQTAQTDFSALTLQHITASDAALEKELDRRIRLTMSEDRIAMLHAYQQKDWKTLGELAHRMAGSVRIARQTEMADLCQKLEIHSQEAEPDVVKCRLYWQELEQRIENFLSTKE